MKLRHLLVTALCVMVACFLIQSCEKSTEPELELESLASFSVGAPDTVTAGQLFTLTVTAVGSEGTKPFKTFDGYVVLSASGGSIAPDSLLLAGGTGSGQVVLSGSNDAQTITATDGNKKGSVIVNAKFMTTLEGDPGDSANEAILPFEFFADGDNYSDTHPSLSGMFVSFNTIMIAFELGTTVSEANAILGANNAQIVGGIPGEEGIAPGVLFLKLSTSTHTEMESALTALNANANVNTVIQDVLMGTNAIPRPNGGNPADWTWENTPGGANWGLERIRVPQMWNFNEAVTKKMTTGAWPPSTALIIDKGFTYAHEDMYSLYTINPLATHFHGAHVAGIIGATYNNGKGIDGICPNVYMLGKDVPLDPGGGTYQDFMSAGQAVISALYFGMQPYVDVINMSFGYNWIDAGIDSNNDTVAQSIVARHAQILINTLNLGTLSIRSPLIVVSAGNGSNLGFGDHDARYNSPMCYAAIEMGIDNIIVVEAVIDSPGSGAGDVMHFTISSRGGHISAPGYDVWGATNESSLYRRGDGTSSAAAVVTGVAAYLYVVEPYLTFTDVKDVLISNALSATDAPPRVDAWSSVVDLDRVRGGDNFLRMMCDIDDGTPDGNQRVSLDGNIILDEDADQDQGIGDGNIDMSDFRRWRDWFLLTHTGTEYYLDGGSNHPKKDVNKDGTVEDAAGENIYPRGDFNGDGVIDETAASYVPGAIGADMTDLEVLQAIFDDPHYSAAELPDLLYSLDFKVDASMLLRTNTNVYAELFRMPSEDLAALHTFTPGESVFVFTIPPHSGGYKVEVTADGEEFEHGSRTFHPGIGGDQIFRPIAYIAINPKATYLHTCGDSDTATTPIELSAYGIKSGDVLCFDNEGSFAYTEDPNWRGYDQVAVFSSSSTLSPSSSSHRVPGAIDAGDNFETWDTNDCGGQRTDIPQDFLIGGGGTIVKVPSGATHLFVCGHDSGYGDNWAPSGRFGLQISIVYLPD